MTIQRGKLVILTAPSGAGQDTVLKLFLAKHPDWWLNSHVTTRDPRPGEVDGQDMTFLSEDEFKARQAAGEFLETFQADGNWRGTLKQPVEDRLVKGENVIIRPDHNGAKAIKQTYPEAITIFLNAESWEILENRLRARQTETEEEIQKRLAWNKAKIAHTDEYDHVVINPEGRPDQAVTEIERILGY